MNKKQGGSNSDGTLLLPELEHWSYLNIIHMRFEHFFKPMNTNYTLDCTYLVILKKQDEHNAELRKTAPGAKVSFRKFSYAPPIW